MIEDAESRAALQRLAAESVGLPVKFSDRVEGDSIAAMRSDAARLRNAVGLDADPARNTDGRFASSSDAMNDAIRSKAGRG